MNNLNNLKQKKKENKDPRQLKDIRIPVDLPVPKCEVCQKKRSAYYCELDKIHYCKKCESKVHTLPLMKEKHAKFIFKEPYIGFLKKEQYQEKIIKELKALHENEPTNEKVLIMLIKQLLILSKINQVSVFLKAFEKLSNETTSDVEELKGDFYQKKNKTKKALLHYEKAIKLNKRSSVLYNKKGDCLLLLSRDEEAEKCYQESIKIDPKNAQGYTNLGYASDKKGKHLKALEQYQKALSLEKNYDSLFNVASVLKTLGRDHQALKFLDQAIEKDKTRPEAITSRGEILRGLGKLKQAIDCFETAIDLNPNYCEAYYHLGLTEIEINKSDELSEIERQCRYEIVLNLREMRKQLGVKSALTNVENKDNFIVDQGKWIKDLQKQAKEQISKRIQECYKFEKRNLKTQFRKMKKTQQEKFKQMRGEELSQLDQSIMKELENERKQQETQLLRQITKETEEETQKEILALNKIFEKRSKSILKHTLKNTKEKRIEKLNSKFKKLSDYLESNQLQTELSQLFQKSRNQLVFEKQNELIMKRQEIIEKKNSEFKNQYDQEMESKIQKFVDKAELKKKNFLQLVEKKIAIEIEKTNIQNKLELSSIKEISDPDKIKEQLIEMKKSMFINSQNKFVNDYKEKKTNEYDKKIKEFEKEKNIEIENLKKEIEKRERRMKQNQGTKKSNNERKMKSKKKRK
ncbi:cellulose synthase operon protein c [Anaeramoeba flamelloides]|uniref:Cellulose synthase operon protein c n=1 Tax=Anaeramoeba flamelloides TaxID=1746091 RepID=A0ABQ8ZB20_9EUKA|nr:cellulose synthase operon protein c [Anaeramoeba flamelloides]